jgi:hypothetical protein
MLFLDVTLLCLATSGIALTESDPVSQMRALAAHQSRGPAVLSDAEPCCSGRPWAPAPAPSAASRRPVLTKMGRHEEFSLWREELPIPKGYTPGVVAGVRTVATPLLSQEKVKGVLISWSCKIDWLGVWQP